MRYSLRERNKIIEQTYNCTKRKRFTFGTIDLFLNKHTLIPHPDTLLMIEFATKILQRDGSIKTVADIGTGSGIIVISLAKRFPKINFFTSDISKKALNLAKKNASINKIKNIQFLQNTRKIWLSEYKKTNIDFIISNPPFVGEKEFNKKTFLLKYPEVKKEPKNAIVTKGDLEGLSPYMEIIKNSKKMNTKRYLFQCNSTNIEPLMKKLKTGIDGKMFVRKDTFRMKRFLMIKL